MNESIKIKTIINERLASKAVVLENQRPCGFCWQNAIKCWKLLWVVASRCKAKECLKGEVTLRQAEANAASIIFIIKFSF